VASVGDFSAAVLSGEEGGSLGWSTPVGSAACGSGGLSAMLAGEVGC
jgi:hypothetical protein